MGPTCFVRVDNQASFTSLRKDKSLEPYGIQLILGEPKNVNKNAVADKAIRELREQIVKLNPSGGKISSHTLALATAFLNDIIRHTGHSSRELWLSRDAKTSENLLIDDKALSRSQQKLRESTHSSSANYHSRNAPPQPHSPYLEPGSSVYVKSDRSKSKSRDQFVVLSVDKESNKASIQKFPMKKFRSHPIQVDLNNLYPTQNCLSPVVSQNTSNLHQRLIPKTTPIQVTRKLPPRPRIPSSSESDTSDDEQSLPTPVTRQQFNVSESVALPLEINDLTPELDELAESVQNLDENTQYLDDEAQVLDEYIPENDNTPEIDENIPRILTLHQPKYGDDDYLRVGDIIVIVHKDYWVKAILHKYAGWPKNHSLYWTYSNLDGSESRSGYLFPGESWGVLRGDDLDVDVSTAKIVLPQPNNRAQ